MVAAVHAYHRLQCAIETLRHAHNSLAVVAPEWLRAHAPQEWAERYAPRAFDHYIPPEKEERQAHAEMVGADGDLLPARAREQTAEYRQEYAQRSGIEGTISHAVRAFGARRCRYIGGAKTHLQQALTATAINFVRVANWLAEAPLARTRQTSFVKLMMRPLPC